MVLLITVWDLSTPGSLFRTRQVKESGGMHGVVNRSLGFVDTGVLLFGPRQVKECGAMHGVVIHSLGFVNAGGLIIQTPTSERIWGYAWCC